MLNISDSLRKKLDISAEGEKGSYGFTISFSGDTFSFD